jgi:hypothetical protein
MKDKVRDQIINLEHISTGKMLADPLTKSLPPNVFREHVADMGLREAYDSWTIIKGPKVKVTVSDQRHAL